MEISRKMSMCGRRRRWWTIINGTEALRALSIRKCSMLGVIITKERREIIYFLNNILF